MEQLEYYQKMCSALRDGTVEALVEQAYEILSMPIVVCDAEYRVISKVPEDIITGDEQWDNNKVGETVDSKYVFSVYTDEHWRIFNEKKSAMVIDWGIFSGIPRYGNILTHKGKFIGSLAIRIGDARREEWHIDFINLFSDLLINVMYGSYRLSRHSDSLKEVLMKAIMNGEASTDEELSILQKESGIRLSPSFYISILSKGNDETVDSGTLTYISEILMAMFGHELHLIRDEMIYILHYSINGGKKEILSRERLAIHKRYGFVECFSSRFSDIKSFGDYLWQAERVLDISKTTEKRTVLSYKSYATDVVMNVLAENISEACIIHPAIRVLQDYDAVNQTHYLETLKCYIESFFSKKKTAEKLFIHRNTLLYRLNKIGELTNVDVTDPRIGFHLLLNFNYLDSETYKRKKGEN